MSKYLNIHNKIWPAENKTNKTEVYTKLGSNTTQTNRLQHTLQGNSHIRKHGRLNQIKKEILAYSLETLLVRTDMI